MRENKIESGILTACKVRLIFTYIVVLCYKMKRGFCNMPYLKVNLSSGGESDIQPMSLQ